MQRRGLPTAGLVLGPAMGAARAMEPLIGTNQVTIDNFTCTAPQLNLAAGTAITWTSQ